MAGDSFQFRALFEYRRQHGDDISLQPGDLLTVAKASLPEEQEGAERSPRLWLHGTNHRTKEKGDFPGTFVEYVGALRTGPSVAKTCWPRTAALTPESLGASPGAEAEPVSEAAVVAVWRLADAIEKHGPDCASVYAAGPSSGAPAELRQALDSDPFSVDLDHCDLSSLADALWGLLLDLPGPVFPDYVHRELLYTAQESQSVDECGQRLKTVLESPGLPQNNHQLLVHLSRHLSRVSRHQQVAPKLLGQSFSEAVFRPPHLSRDVNPEHHVRILEALITTGGLEEMQPAPGRT